MVVEVGADLGADGESWRHGQADAGHFGEVGAFAAEESFLRAISIRLAGAPGVNVFRGFAACFRGGLLSGFLRWHGMGRRLVRGLLNPGAVAAMRPRADDGSASGMRAGTLVRCLMQSNR